MIERIVSEREMKKLDKLWKRLEQVFEIEWMEYFSRIVKNIDTINNMIEIGKYINILKLRFALWRVYNRSYKGGQLFRVELINLILFLRSCIKCLEHMGYFKPYRKIKNDKWLWYTDETFTIDIFGKSPIGLA